MKPEALLPGQVVGVMDAAVHTLPVGVRVQVGCVAPASRTLLTLNRGLLRRCIRKQLPHTTFMGPSPISYFPCRFTSSWLTSDFNGAIIMLFLGSRAGVQADQPP